MANKPHVNDVLHDDRNGLISFANALRQRLDTQRSVTEVARAAGLDPSIVSRLASRDPATRRAPTMEHLMGLARAFDTTAVELVEGTDAHGVLGDWVPRRAFDLEVGRRLALHQELRETHGRLSALQGELAGLRETLKASEVRAREAEEANRRAEARIALQLKAYAYLTAQASEQRTKLEAAERAWSDLQARLSTFEEQQRGAQPAAGALLFTALLGGIVGLALGAATEKDEPTRRE